MHVHSVLRTMLTCFVLEMKHLLAGAENTTAAVHICQGNMPQAAICNTKVDQLTLNIKRGGLQVKLVVLIDHYNRACLNLWNLNTKKYYSISCQSSERF